MGVERPLNDAGHRKGNLISKILQPALFCAINPAQTNATFTLESGHAVNRIQFQAGLSLPLFLEQFGTETPCEAALERARWPDGFRCPRCGQTAHCVWRSGGRNTNLRSIRNK